MCVRRPKDVPASDIRGLSDVIFCLLDDTVLAFQESSEKAGLETIKHETIRNQRDTKHT